MTPEYTSLMAVGLLMMSLLSVLTLGALITMFVVQLLARQRRSVAGDDKGSSGLLTLEEGACAGMPVFQNPSRWLTIESRNPLAAQSALGLENATACSWAAGLPTLTDQTLFISPPIDAWLLVVGPGLPDPAEDIDECYRFLVDLSREMGRVHFYYASRVVDHHAWAHIEDGKVIRAYAWAGATLWNQGAMTKAEKDLGFKCFDYGEDPGSVVSLDCPSNADKVPALAAQWSLDPDQISPQRLASGQGIAGNRMPVRRH